MEGRVVLLTGAAGGIASGLARGFADRRGTPRARRP
jgi:NAD(P)-dependent dehydrogenase (short-subunit alcohol dehydrogenase family)